MRAIKPLLWVLPLVGAVVLAYVGPGVDHTHALNHAAMLVMATGGFLLLGLALYQKVRHEASVGELGASLLIALGALVCAYSIGAALPPHILLAPLFIAGCLLGLAGTLLYARARQGRDHAAG